MAIGLRAITPRHAPIGTDNVYELIRQAIGPLGFAGDAVRDMSDYPPARPWRHPPPRTGPRANGRRTGTYGRNWRIRGPRVSPRGVEAEAVNHTRYGVYVGGPLRGRRGQRQTRFMRERGWPSVTTVGRNLWNRRYRRQVVMILTQQDRRIRRRRMQ